METELMRPFAFYTFSQCRLHRAALAAPQKSIGRGKKTKKKPTKNSDNSQRNEGKTGYLKKMNNSKPMRENARDPSESSESLKPVGRSESEGLANLIVKSGTSMWPSCSYGKHRFVH